MAKRRSLRDTVPKNYACASPSASPSPSPSIFSQEVEAGNVTSLDASKDAPPNLPSRNSISMASTRKWSLDALLKHSSNFVPAQRVPATSPGLSETLRKFETLGEPLVVEGYHHHPAWPHEMFTLDYFVQNTTSDEINVRNVHDWTDRTIKLSDFIEHCRNTSHYASPDEKQRLYGKDAECPEPWENWLHNGGVIPLSLVENGPADFFRYRPDSAAVQTLMCYLGIGDTFTPCHKDLCASSGQNLMCYTEDGGASFWFMTKGSSSADAAKYFHSLGRELDHENHVIALEELANAPFQVFIIEQKLGDLVLVPPRSCHQVVNFGGITIKTSWSRMTLDGLSVAYFHELPIYRRVCRPEIYRVKDTIHHALLGQTREIFSSLGCKESTSVTVGELKELLFLYDCILAEEFSAGHGTMHHILSQSGNVSDGAHLECDFCHGDIFQSFFDCSQCTNDQNPLLICSGCFVEGRRCRCKSMRPVQYRNFKQLIEIRDQAENAIRQYEEKCGQMFTQELALENASVPPLFRAACYLNKNLKDIQRLCSTRAAHNCGLSATLYCKQCHGSRCLSYVMNGWHVHPAEALMAYSSDPTNTTYHTLHLNARHKFKKEKQALEQSQKLGTRLQGYSLLLYNALNFVQCNPLNLEFVQPGWYDRKYEVLGGQVEEDSTLEESEFDERSSSGTIVAQRSSTRLSGGRKQDSNDHQMHVDRTTPIKKRTSVYVDVPKAPYPIHRQRASSGETTNAMVHADMGESPRHQSNWRRSALLHSPTRHPLHSRHSMTVPEASKGSALERSPELGVTTLASIPSLAKKKLPSSLRFKKISRMPHDAESSSLVSLPSQEADRAAEMIWGIRASQTADPSNPQVFNSSTQYPRPAKLTSSPTSPLVLDAISAEQNMEIASLKAMREVGMLMQETADTQLHMLYDHIGQGRQHRHETQRPFEPHPRRFERPQSSHAFYNKQAMYHQDPPRAPRGMTMRPSFWNDRNHNEHRQDNSSFAQHQVPVGFDLPAMSGASTSRSETFKLPKKRRLSLDNTGSGASELLEARYRKGNKYMEQVQEAASEDQRWEDIRYEQLDEESSSLQGSRVISMHRSDGGNMHMNFEHELTKNHWID